MKNKKIVVSMLVAMLSLAGIAHAYTYFWCYNSGDWDAAAIWGGTAPSPSVEGQALVYNGATLVVNTSGQGAWDCTLGYAGGNDLGATVTINSDIIWTVHNSLMLADGAVGIINVYGTAQASGLRMGLRTVGEGTINVYSGGTLKVGYGGWPINIGEVASSNINLIGTGSMEIGGDGGWYLNLNSGRGHIDIEAGQLKVLGDRRTELQNFINNGWITSRGGNSSHCYLIVTYVDGYTYVKTEGCTCTTYLPADLNHDCYVDMLDLAYMSQNWLDCTITTDANCVN
jgi:hypothetical protein